jgi:hypothetical protein
MCPAVSKDLIRRLLSEAPKIAPSIARNERDKPCAFVTDERLDRQSVQRWELETTAVLRMLSQRFGSVFDDLFHRYMEESASQNQDDSLKVLWAKQSLTTALELLDSQVVQIAVGAEMRAGASVHPVMPGEAPTSTPKVESLLEWPEKVTIRWLLRHVPVGVWAWGGVLLLAAFGLGVRMSDVPAFRALLKTLGG